MPNIPEYDDQTKLKYEKEVVGIYISGHPLGNYVDVLKAFTFNGGMLQKQENPDEMMEEENVENSFSYTDDFAHN
jgi:DNA polymerase-3 subunit alpha